MPVQTQHIITQRFVQCMQTLLANHKVPSARQLAITLEYKPQGLSEVMNGKRNAPVELLQRAVQLYQLNVNFLFSGEGEMFEGGGPNQPVNTRVVVTDIFQKERIVHVPVSAYAGYRDNLTEPIFVQDLPTYSLPENILRHGSYRSFDVAGDSMEPTLLTGDKIIGAFVEPQYWEQGIKDHQIHVLVTYNEVVVKRVMNFIRAEKMLELHSDNKGIPPYHLPIQELREAWIVRLRITPNLNRAVDLDIIDEIRHEIRHTLAALTNGVQVH
jgi:phage repressor protein C with HTH and peptisase S24 domain